MSLTGQSQRLHTSARAYRPHIVVVAVHIIRCRGLVGWAFATFNIASMTSEMYFLEDLNYLFVFMQNQEIVNKKVHLHPFI